MYSFNLLQDHFINKYPDKAVLIIVLGSFVCALIGYLIGSVNFSIIISKLFYKDDIRSYGSGNAGSTNMLRTHGTLSALATFAGDLIKTAVAVFAGAVIFNIWGAYISGFFCVIGHIFPLYFKFKGGKGVATVAMLIALTNIKTFTALLLVFLIVVLISRYVSLGSIISAALYPIILFNMLELFKAPHKEYVGVVFAFVIAAVVIIKHRSNIKKILNRKESKISFSKHGSAKKEPDEK